ncbi:MAG: hypothetical protein MR423_03635 [Firmicutes bacterium]|nr:hypothetical protein [Bacillota bacterium]MDY3658828.1 hypothetical protein [Eubacteriales bacterium]
MENEQEKIEESFGDKELKVKKSDLKSATNKAIKKKVQPWWMWPVKILVITLFLSLSFSVLSEVLLSNVGIVVSVVVILFLLFVGIVADMIGVATTACSIEPFTAMCSRKVRGAKVAMGLVKNAEKVSSICNDVVGDICGILSGAAGASIAVKFISENMANSIQILIAGTVSAVIAGLTIFGKAMCKKYAITHCTKIVLGVGKCFSIFSRRKPKEKKKQEKVEKE